VKLDWETFGVRAEVPFRISRSVQDRVERVWVRLEADGVEGWGEADPSPYYGESADTVGEALERMRPALEAEREPERLEAIERTLRRTVEGNGSAHAAVSAALHDLVGKRAGQPVWRLLGLDPADAPESSFTIGIDEPARMAERARDLAAWPILKVKLGTEDDEAIVEAIREAVPGRRLRVDANAAWTPETALRRIERLREHGVEMVEQPLPPGDREGYRRLHAESPLPIWVDESCIRASDVPGLAGLCTGVNVKLAKCGGIREAVRIVHAARACGLGCMLGCMLESTLGIAASAQVAPLFDFADLDGAALLRDDPFRGPGLEGPRLVLNDEPGLGVRRR
jgi:L-alanine-DL-glutamate epimerase-like enolase superfamily enzyme